MIKSAEKIDYDIKSAPLGNEETRRLSKVIADYKKRKDHTPENVGGGCMTGHVMSDSEANQVASFIDQYKSTKK
jgi:hypothetical protein